MCANVANKQIS